MRVINYTSLMVIECDYPGCDETILTEDIAPGNCVPCEKTLNARGWAFITPPASSDSLAFCPDCKNKELPTDQKREVHDCIYASYTKKGKPSELGSIQRCLLCDGLKL